MDNKYLTTSQAAAFLHVTRFTILNWIKNGKLVAISTLGGHQRIPQESILALLAKRDAGTPKNTAAQKIATVQKIITVPTISTVPPCWKAKETAASKRHHCADCLVFKEQINRCFLAVRKFVNQKVQCGVDCLNCEYLSAHYPEEKRAMESVRPKSGPVEKPVAKPVASQPHFNETAKSNLLQKSFYVSGKCFAMLKKTGKKSKNRKSEAAAVGSV